MNLSLPGKGTALEGCISALLFMWEKKIRFGRNSGSISTSVSMKEPSLQVNNRKIEVRGEYAFKSVSPISNVFRSRPKMRRHETLGSIGDSG